MVAVGHLVHFAVYSAFNLTMIAIAVSFLLAPKIRRISISHSHRKMHWLSLTAHLMFFTSNLCDLIFLLGGAKSNATLALRWFCVILGSGSTLTSVCVIGFALCNIIMSSLDKEDFVTYCLRRSMLAFCLGWTVVMATNGVVLSAGRSLAVPPARGLQVWYFAGLASMSVVAVPMNALFVRTWGILKNVALSQTLRAQTKKLLVFGVFMNLTFAYLLGVYGSRAFKKSYASEASLLNDVSYTGLFYKLPSTYEFEVGILAPVFGWVLMTWWSWVPLCCGRTRAKIAPDNKTVQRMTTQDVAKLISRHSQPETGGSIKSSGKAGSGGGNDNGSGNGKVRPLPALEEQPKEDPAASLGIFTSRSHAATATGAADRLASGGGGTVGLQTSCSKLINVSGKSSTEGVA